MFFSLLRVVNVVEGFNDVFVFRLRFWVFKYIENTLFRNMILFSNAHLFDACMKEWKKLLLTQRNFSQWKI